MALAGLLHRKLIAVEVVAEGAAEVFFGAAQNGFEDAGVGRADGFVLLGLQAELAQPLDVLEGGEHMVEVLLHAAHSKPRERVKVEHPGLPVFGVGVALQLAVALEVEPVGGFLLGGQTAPDAVQDLVFPA